MRNNTPVTGKEQSYGDNANLLSTTNLKGQITYANSEFAKIAGFSLDELVGQPHNIVRHPDMPPIAFKMLWDRLNAGRSWMGLVKNRCENGDHYWVDAYATPIQKDGKTAEFQSVRVKPNRSHVARAEALYAKVLQGKTPSYISRNPLSTLGKQSIGLWLALALGAGISSAITAQPSIATLSPLLLTGLLIQALLWWLWRPMAEALEEARAISDDPVAMHVYTGRNDDIGQLQLAMKMLNAETGGLVGRIADDSGHLFSQSQELLQSVELSNNHVNAMHHQTDQVATAINEMSATVQEVATNAAAAATAANEAQNGASEGKQLVRLTADNIGALADEINRSAGVISQLEKDCEGINTIVDVIRSVAEQTNLLALNAAIEAARAGEQGRGFAVVADEVRTLANRTHQSTAEITDMIEKLQQGSRAAVSSMQEAQQQTESSVTRAQSTAESIDRVTASIDTINEMNQQIATAVEEQSAVAEDINQNVTAVSQLTEELSQLAGDNSRIGTDVNSLSQSLSEMAKQFFTKRS